MCIVTRHRFGVEPSKNQAEPSYRWNLFMPKVLYGDIDGKFFVLLAFLSKLQTFLELGFSRSIYATELTKIFPTKHFQSDFSEPENSIFNLYKIENISMGWNYLEMLQKLSSSVRAINELQSFCESHVSGE